MVSYYVWNHQFVRLSSSHNIIIVAMVIKLGCCNDADHAIDQRDEL